jgi:hypothetical protein
MFIQNMNRNIQILVDSYQSLLHTLTVHYFFPLNYMFQPSLAIIRLEYKLEVVALELYHSFILMMLSQIPIKLVV